NLANNDSQDIPLCIAAKRAHFEIVKYLVKHGANITKKCSGNKTALEAAKQKKKKLDRRKEHGDCRSQENYPNLVKIIEFLEEEKREQEVS
ncbi:ankyrin repeat domain-containing protein, partial [Candidatus Babeliales bacterium]|nr:ankyrin repeat domain-containing protein [Candidatus Babeliales bacterium]